MAIHVAILREPYLSMLLSGQKTVESRLMKTRSVPFRRVRVGERVFVKLSGGPFRATTLVREVADYPDLTPPRVEELRQQWDPEVCGGPEYWAAKSDVRYATMLRLERVEPLTVGPRYAVQSMRAWYVLDEALSPLQESALTAGALNNAYLNLPGVGPTMRQGPFTLVLPDESEVETQLWGRSNRVRWRGWRPYYDAAQLRPADRVRLVALGDRRYRVSFHPDAGVPPLAPRL